jgi:hypothetical protein
MLLMPYIKSGELKIYNRLFVDRFFVLFYTLLLESL